MSSNQKNSFPVMAPKQWWTLRKKFKQSIPPNVNKHTLGALLKMHPESARANVLTALKILGFAEEGDKTNVEIAKRWRDDEEYPLVCKEIAQKVYPEDLLGTFPNPSEDQDGVKRWFANHTGAGVSGVAKMTSFYTMLMNGDPSKSEEPTKNTGNSKAIKSIASKSPRTVSKMKTVEEAKVGSEVFAEPKRQTLQTAPALHIDIQIHISSEASAEQIDQIFASMAKHLNIGGEVGR